MQERTDHQPQQPTPAPEAQLTAALAGWASRRGHLNTALTGTRLLRVMQILGRPAYQLHDLGKKADEAARAAATSSAHEMYALRRAATAAEKAAATANDQLFADVDNLFTALTGLPADSPEALDTEFSYAQVASDARLLLEVAA
ncbi:hypothetical protein PV755_44665 [Streptomyces caniscabiei]|uniref:hypothetical protein n=1 Tax=Streptomyces caniscabiei TaxID=2746961 RepID=UPI0029AAA261|nr:hypothetical protein [Streptomyces caniscabiei]MDX3515916.1 hypothetical protein [Streptomyces caniscabiei]MDX3725096.1 hypothetical protein [Streptomyces caniscabiei]